MSSKTNSDAADNSAEKAFREAFNRLKDGQPVRLAKGTRVSQNNVAKEAGCDPSALKKSRYPALIAEIQAWLRDHPETTARSSRQRMIGQRNKNFTLQERIEGLTSERDHCASLLVEADAQILELVHKVARLEAMLPSNVIDLGAENAAGNPDGLAGAGTRSSGIRGARARREEPDAS